MPHADLLRRVFDLPGHGLTQALAESILARDFPDDDAARIEQLNMRANEGQLTDDEQAELEAYINVSDLLAYWQSRARQAVHPARMTQFSGEVRRRANDRCEYCRLSLLQSSRRRMGRPFLGLNRSYHAAWSGYSRAY
jgi:uncharacterized protein (UPF0305 family)